MAIKARLSKRESLVAQMSLYGGTPPIQMTNITLSASAWVGSSSPYAQTVTVEGATKNSMIDLQPSVDQLESLCDMNIMLATENNDGMITIYALGDKPEEDYTMQATIMEVVA